LFLTLRVLAIGALALLWHGRHLLRQKTPIIGRIVDIRCGLCSKVRESELRVFCFFREILVVD